jgi:hypothetical protein
MLTSNVVYVDAFGLEEMCLFSIRLDLNLVRNINTLGFLCDHSEGYSIELLSMDTNNFVVRLFIIQVQEFD